MVGGPADDDGMHGQLFDLWLHDHAPERSYRVSAVVSLLGPKRQATGLSR